MSVRRAAWLLATLLAAGCTLSHNALTSDGPGADVRDVPSELHDGVGEDVRPSLDVADGFDVVADATDVADVPPADADAGLDAADAGLDAADAQDVLDDTAEAGFDAPVVEASASTGGRGEPCRGGTSCDSASDECAALGGGDTVCRACGAPGNPCCAARTCPSGGTPADEPTGGGTVCVCTADGLSNAGALCAFGVCGAGLRCGAGFRCLECGQAGDPCCLFGQCYSGTHCGTTPAMSEAICR